MNHFIQRFILLILLYVLRMYVLCSTYCIRDDSTRSCGSSTERRLPCTLHNVRVPISYYDEICSRYMCIKYSYRYDIVRVNRFYLVRYAYHE